MTQDTIKVPTQQIYQLITDLRADLIYASHYS